MMKDAYLAIDIGASSGRHIVGFLEDGKIRMQEVYRFKNGAVEQDGHLLWPVDQLFAEVKNGLKACVQQGFMPVSVGIDTWGVDYVLVDKEGKRTGNAVCYRDSRTQGIDKKLYEKIAEADLYRRSGIQKQLFNTIYQLYYQKLYEEDQLDAAEHFLMMPEYLTFLLTGKICNEYTNATTAQLINVRTNDWDYELIDLLGLPRRLFGPLSMPGTKVGALTPEVAAEVGFNTTVIVPATHDTGSAVMAVPATGDDHIYLSSGTWSLIGVERKQADCSQKAQAYNFTNEGGYEHRFRFLKNIMGLWMMQNLRRELDLEGKFDQIYALAEQGSGFAGLVDVNDQSFLAPASMKDAVLQYFTSRGLKAPQNTAELIYCVYHSLAHSYALAINEIEELTKRTFSSLNIIGGGCQDKLLNRITAQLTGKKVYSGPIEATAVGNIICQMLSAGIFPDLSSAREAVARSFEVRAVA